MAATQTRDKEDPVIARKALREREKVKANLKALHKEMDEGPQVTFKFSNAEDPPGGSNPTPLITFFFAGRKFEIKHGDIRTWPKCVVDHLNSLKVPVYENKLDPVTKVIRSVQTTERERFFCMPVSEQEQKKQPKASKSKKDEENALS